MGVKKTKSKSKGGNFVTTAAKKAKDKIMGKSSSSGGKRRGRHGVTWWANRVLVEKLKKKYHRIKYGSVR